MHEDTAPIQSGPPKPRRWLTRRNAFTTVGVVAAFGIGAGIGSAGGHTTIKTVAGPTVVKHVNVPGPTVYKTRTVTKKVPGPTVYKVKYVPASQGPAGTVIASYSGSGNRNTGSFTVPSSGDYTVRWSYSGNVDPTLGGGTNFSIQPTNSSGLPGDYPNDIAASGSGSTEDTGMSGAQSFNVQATGQWSVTVASAP